MPHCKSQGMELWDDLTRGISTPLLMKIGGVIWVLQPYQPVLGWVFSFTGSRIL